MKRLMLLSVALVLIVGCRTSEPVRDVYSGESRISTYTGVGVNIEGKLDEDGNLDPAPYVGQFLPNQEITIVGARAKTNDNGIARIQFSLGSRRDKPHALQYRFTWMDKDGFVLQPDQNPWQTLHLAGHEVAEVESVAQSAKGRAFRLVIRPLEFKK